MLEEFRKYVEEYDMNDEHIKLKYEHSLRVYQLSLEIGKSLNVDNKLLNIIGLIGLLHDIGRFEQWKEYHTFNDRRSVDHGLLSAQILFDDGLIRRFIKGHKYNEMIRTAIENHSKYQIPDDLIGLPLLLSQIIRDADKLDIFMIRVENQNFALPSKGNVSDTVIEKFRKEESIKFEDTNSSNDSIILTLAMIFDINFRYSLKLLMKKGYIDKIIESIKAKEQQEVRGILDNYINNKLGLNQNKKAEINSSIKLEEELHNVRKTIQFKNN
jgi:HD superfamily phosphohydrolase YqeK